MHDRRGLKADDPIADKEYVGRRLAARPALVGAADQARQTKRFDLRDFEEKRPPHELSLDWLGKTSVEPKVARELEPQAKRMFAAQTPTRNFAGWVYLQAAKLSKGHRDLPCGVIAAPEKPGQPDDPDHNPYHVIVRASPKFGHPYLVAQHLYFQFLNNGKLHLVPRLPFYVRLLKFLRSLMRIRSGDRK